MGAGIRWSYKVWSWSVLCGVWHPLHHSTLLPLPKATTVRSNFRATGRLTLISAVWVKLNKHTGTHDWLHRQLSPDWPRNWSCWGEVMVAITYTSDHQVQHFFFFTTVWKFWLIKWMRKIDLMLSHVFLIFFFIKYNVTEQEKSKICERKCLCYIICPPEFPSLPF